MGEVDAERHALTLSSLVARATAHQGSRVLIGICGAPGAGKSTLAERLAAAVGEEAVYVGMDGFHLAQVELRRLNRTERKGAADTFDAAGYVHLLTRLAAPPTETIYAPEFRRELEEPIAGAVPVHPAHRIVVTEGNYLLRTEPPWHRIKGILTETWFLSPAEHLRRARLRARHQAYGRTPEEAEERTMGSDERNAVQINATRQEADLVIQDLRY